MFLRRRDLVPLLLTLAALLSGCGTLSNEADKSHALIDRNGIDILIEDASRKTTVFKDKHSIERFCRSPNPDFATGTSNSVSLGLAKGTSIGTGSSAEIDAFGGRSPSVLITRELMYRACELALNLDANEALSKEIYWKFLSTIEIALKSQTGVGSQGSAVSNSSPSLPLPGPTNSPSVTAPVGQPTSGSPTTNN
jgi:hypothetical protein